MFIVRPAFVGQGGDGSFLSLVMSARWEHPSSFVCLVPWLGRCASLCRLCGHSAWPLHEVPSVGQPDLGHGGSGSSGHKSRTVTSS